MIKITLKDLIYMIPDLIGLFLPGFIFMITYNWLNNNKNDISLITIWSLFISVLIKSFCTTIHSFVFRNVQFIDSSKIIIYSLMGVLLSFLIIWLKKSVIIQRLLYISNNKSINNDIFDDIIDYEEPTMMKICIKNSSVYYVGKFCFREEKGLDSWIALINYCYADKKTNEVIYDSCSSGLNSIMIINLKDVERIEIIYENESKVWKRLSLTEKYSDSD